MSEKTSSRKPDHNVVEKYQQMLADDPNSKVFAPLADAYRQLGMMKEALDLCKEGVRKHPDFPGGRIALANIYIDQELPESALNELERAYRVAPENLAAIHKMAELYLHLKKPKQALSFYKKLLFLSPTNTKAKSAVSKLESLTADEYEDDELFQMQRLHKLEEVGAHQPIETLSPISEEADLEYKLERSLSLADAFFARNDLEKANDILIRAESEIGSHPQIVKRLKILHLRQLDTVSAPKNAQELHAPRSRKVSTKDAKIQRLQELLITFQSLRKPSGDGLDL